MATTRRSLLLSAAATLAVASRPVLLRADIPAAGGQLTTVSDGNLVLPMSIGPEDAPADQVQAIRRDFGLDADQSTPPCNLTLFRGDGRVVLFDAGSGPDFMPSAGKLADSLDAAGVSADDVTDVIFTHAHPDHIWGLLDEFDEVPFPQARFFMGRAEWDYWWNPETVDTIGEARAFFAVGAKRRMERIEGMVSFFDDGDEVLPGILAVGTPGHTPGHMSFLVGDGPGVLVTGDAITNHHANFRHPGWHGASDQDPTLGAQTRLRLLDRLATDGHVIAGFHLPEGGIGRVERADGAFRFVPEV